MKKKVVLGICVAVVLSAVNVGAESVEANWKKHCMSCHGADGKGKTKAGRKAKAKDLTDAALQKQFSDEQMFDQIKNGMKDDKGKEMMKGYGAVFSDAEIKNLVAYVRKFKK